MNVMPTLEARAGLVAYINVFTVPLGWRQVLISLLTRPPYPAPP
jgi:hypothetical protein